MRNLIPKLGLALVLSSGLILSACEPETGETVATIESLESRSNLNNLNNIEIDLVDTTVATDTKGHTESSVSCINSVILEAFEQQRNSIQVKGCGQVVAVLADDNKGSRHQRFIVELEGIEPKHTILIAHNIDLAPRVDALQKGDEVVFYGQYEYNPQGGVVHWTHHDPAARHQHGWIEYKGQRFQ